MKYLTLVLLLTTGCASAPQPKLNIYGGALPELYRAGTPMEVTPSDYHKVSHTCVSSPIYDLYGYFIRTDVRCW